MEIHAVIRNLTQRYLLSMEHPHDNLRVSVHFLLSARFVVNLCIWSQFARKIIQLIFDALVIYVQVYIFKMFNRNMKLVLNMQNDKIG